jgi:hypothetical protein
MRIEGRSSTEICEELGVKQRTLYIWFSDPLVKEALVSAQANLATDLREKLAQVTLVGLEALREIAGASLEGPIPVALKHQAACDILDRVPLARPDPTTPRPEGVSRALRAMEGMDEQERRQFTLAAARKLLESEAARRAPESGPGAGTLTIPEPGTIAG